MSNSASVAVQLYCLYCESMALDILDPISPRTLMHAKDCKRPGPSVRTDLITLDKEGCGGGLRVISMDKLV